jgi:hypothetical protein
MAKLHESLLERSRPPWELRVIDGVVGNHVALTCIDGALRNYLADLGVELHRPITIQMPANLRREGEKTAGKARSATASRPRRSSRTPASLPWWRRSSRR